MVMVLDVLVTMRQSKVFVIAKTNNQSSSSSTSGGAKVGYRNIGIDLNNVG